LTILDRYPDIRRYLELIEKKRSDKRIDLIGGKDLYDGLKHSKIVLATILNVQQRIVDNKLKYSDEENGYWNRALKVATEVIDR